MTESGAILHLTEALFHQKIAKGLTFVDFYADWCGPCRMLAPVLEQIAKDEKGRVTVAKVNIDSESGIASEFQIASVPTMILFKDGKEIDRIVGLRNAEAIKKFLASHK